MDNARFSASSPVTSGQADPRVSSLVKAFNRGFDESISGAKKGAKNFGIGVLNTVTNTVTGGNLRSLFGFGNPLEIERSSCNSSTEAKVGFGTEIGLMVGTIKI